jgi:histone H3/H4
MARRHQLADHCLVLLQHCATHRDDDQTQVSLSRMTGIPRTNLARILKEAQSDREGSLLCRVACKYRFDFELSKKANKILDAVYVGYG